MKVLLVVIGYLLIARNTLFIFGLVEKEVSFFRKKEHVRKGIKISSHKATQLQRSVGRWTQATFRSQGVQCDLGYIKLVKREDHYTVKLKKRKKIFKFLLQEYQDFTLIPGDGKKYESCHATTILGTDPPPPASGGSAWEGREASW